MMLRTPETGEIQAAEIARRETDSGMAVLYATQSGPMLAQRAPGGDWSEIPGELHRYPAGCVRPINRGDATAWCRATGTPAVLDLAALRGVF